jgi:hypothetical protein
MEGKAMRRRLGEDPGRCRMETPAWRLRLATGLPRGQRLEGHQKGEDAGACRWDNN